ncbi:MAG: hypothetical protein AAGF01_01605 [Cyanobacteria bacterium P01_G01_bin.38]
MKLKRYIAGLCLGLLFVVSIPKPARAEPISFWMLMKLFGVALATGSFWMTWQNSADARIETAKDSVLNHLGAEAEFPLSVWCDSPSIKSGEVTQGWFVSVDDTESVRELIRGSFCTPGGTLFQGKYLIGIFSNEGQAQNFATVIRDRMDSDFDVYVATESVDISDLDFY